MARTLLEGKPYKYLFHLQLLPVLVFVQCLSINETKTTRQISAAEINISGRQRMLSQRSALLSLQLVCTQNKDERQSLRYKLLEAIELMEKSHNGLTKGDIRQNLTGVLSPKIKAMYFESPLNLDKQVCNYIAEVRALLQSQDHELTLDNLHLGYILQVSANDLLAGLDAVVSQYQLESDIEQLAIDIYQWELYQKSFTADKVAQQKDLELEKAQEELQETQAQLLHNEKMTSLGHLVAGVAHEINNPMNFIYGNLTFAFNYVDDLLSLFELYQQAYPQPPEDIQNTINKMDLNFVLEDLPKVLISMRVGVDRICQLVRSLLTFSRNDKGEMSLVDIHQHIDSTLLILQSRLKANSKHPNISIVKNYGNLPMVECHIGQLNQVFMNILSNAIDALEEKSENSQEDFSPCIQITTKVNSNNAIAMQISDNGPGMTETVKKRLFDAFFTTKPIGKGTGLGLSISQEIVVENHGGSLKCNSAPGQGTQFSIEIPVRQCNELISQVPA